MTDKQFDMIVDLLKKILTEVKLTNHSGLKGPIRTKKF